MRTRDVFLELLSPALVRARRERPGRPFVPVAPARPCPEPVGHPMVLRAAR